MKRRNAKTSKLKHRRHVLSLIIALVAAVCSGAAARTPPCPADVAPIASSGDGIVNAADLLAIINQWGPCPPGVPPGSCPADIAPLTPNSQGDGTVNVADLLMVINSWGPCPPACAPGTWASTPAAVYNCAFGLVSFNITQWVITQSGGTLSVSGNGLPGPGGMTGPAVECAPGRTFTVTKVYPGSCTETYTLSGTFNSANQFTGTFTANYTPNGAGACIDCTIHTWNVTATRQ